VTVSDQSRRRWPREIQPRLTAAGVEHKLSLSNVSLRRTPISADNEGCAVNRHLGGARVGGVSTTDQPDVDLTLPRSGRRVMAGSVSAPPPTARARVFDEGTP
jgi:hypothetical protein